MGKYFRTLILFFFLILIVLMTGCSGQFHHERIPKVIDGTLDLAQWDLQESGAIKLNGMWELYWEELISPEEFSSYSNSIDTKYIKVPAAWNNYTLNHKGLTGDGYATYRLLITTDYANKSLGMEIPKIRTAYKLWVNNDLLATNGAVGKDAPNSTPHFQPKTVFFDSSGGEIELVLQISNFHHQNGGILGSLRLGTADQINLSRNWNLAFDLFLFGSLFIVGIYHIVFFLYRKKEMSNLYFGSFCMMIGIRSIFVGEMFVFNLFPNFDWELALKVEYLTFYLGTPLFILYLKSLLYSEISSKLIKISMITALIFSTLVLINSVKVYAQYNIIYQGYTIVIILYLLYALTLACLRKRESAIAIGLAVIFFVLTVINDILYESSLVYLSRTLVTTNLSSWGFLVFVFSQSTILSRKIAHAYSKIEEISLNLQQLNENLEDKVLDRTIALEKSNIELEKAYNDLTKLEESRIDLITNISHDLRSPMTSVLGYVNAILDGIVEDPNQLNKYLLRIKERVYGLNHLIQELFDLTQLECRELNLDLELVSVDGMMQKVYEKYLLDVQRAGIDLKLLQEKHLFYNNNIYLEIDFPRIDRAFANVIFNAIKHTPIEGTIVLSYGFNDISEPSEIIISITDNGPGICSEDLSKVFDRFFIGSKSRTSGSSGLGLSITKEIIEYHRGRIWITSTLGFGTTVYFSLPIKQL